MIATVIVHMKQTQKVGLMLGRPQMLTDTDECTHACMHKRMKKLIPISRHA